MTKVVDIARAASELRAEGREGLWIFGGRISRTNPIESPS